MRVEQEEGEKVSDDKRRMLNRHVVVLVITAAGLVLSAVFGWLAGTAFLCSLFLIGAAIPLVLSLGVQFSVCRMKKIPFQIVFTSPDVLIFLLMPSVWSYAITLGDSKSLSYLIEVPMIGVAWSLCVVVRTFFVLRNRSCAIWLGSWITVALTTIIAALMGVFYPELPE